MNIRDEHFHLRKELESIKAIYSECNNQALKDKPLLQSSKTWQKPGKSFKPTTSFPACNPVTTSNQFEQLPDCPTDDVDVTSAPAFDVQIDNVRLQRQVQFLRDQVANSVSAQQQRKPISTNKSYLETRNNSSKQTVAIIGDSIIKQLDEKKLSHREKM